MKHHRTELSKYFKYVKVCVACKQKYGSDCIHELEDKICPGCTTMGMRAGWKDYLTGASARKTLKGKRSEDE